MKRLKRLLALSLALLCLLTLAGCHGTKRERGAASPAVSDEARYKLPDHFDESVTHEITFWAKSDNNKVQTAIYVQAIQDFEELYPNIRVRLKQYFDYGRIYQDVITNIATGTTPNVCITYPDHIATYLAGEGTVVRVLGESERPELSGLALRGGTLTLVGRGARAQLPRAQLRLEEEGVEILDSALSRDQISFELPRGEALRGLRALHALCFS